MIESWLKDNVGYEVFNPDLSQIRLAYESLSIDLSETKIITVAGTNGKGQCARYLYYYLKNKFQVALWTSPHVFSACERIKNNSGDISKERFLEVSKWLKKHLEINKIKLSYFEFLFLLFVYESKNCEYFILEVGLGGRLDATNTLDASYALITSISRDHQELLGNTYKKILLEKLGIVKDKTRLLTSFEIKYLRQITSKYYNKNYCLDVFERELAFVSDEFDIRNKKLCTQLLKLLGHDVQLHELNDQQLFNKSYQFNRSDYFLSPAHNPDGARKLVQFLRKRGYNYDYILVSFSKRKLEDAISMIKTLQLFLRHNGELKLTLCSFDHLKAMSREELLKISRRCRIEFVDSFKKFSEDIKVDSKVLCCGSNYFLSTVLQSNSSAR